MNLAEVTQLFADGEGDSLRLGEGAFTEMDGIIVSDDWVPLPVRIASFFAGDKASGIFDLDVIDEHGQLLGRLCLCKELGEVDVASITDPQYAAYISEVQRDRLGQPFSFSKDYVVIRANRYADYRTGYMNSSSVWGGFLHDNVGTPLASAHKHPLGPIMAVSGLTFPTTYHEESCVRSVAEPYGFERALKLYHLLELLFDWDFVKTIQGLGNDLYGIGQLLSQYERGELDRLRDVIRNRCDNIARIESRLNHITTDPAFVDTGRTIFYKYGKKGNPISEETTYNDLMGAGGFSQANAKTLKLGAAAKHGAAYDKLIVDVTAYWVYRIRCSIAHNRIGEYVMCSTDEKFVVEFAEPLLRELLCQALSK
jgi:hypothetical protein